MKIKIGGAEHKAMLAMRAGPLNISQSVERFGNSNAIYKLVNAGYVRKVTYLGLEAYSLTLDGLAACPPRRSTAPLAGEKRIRKAQQTTGAQA